MRIAVLHPTYWPEVRRGSERLAHDLGVALAARGHQVSLLTTHLGRRAVAVEDGVRVVRARRVPPLPGMSWYDEYAGAIPATVLGLARGHYDLAHALHPTDAWSAWLARRAGGPPYVLSVHGIVDRTYLVRRRHRLENLRAAADGAAAVTALSIAAAEPLRRYALAEPELLPGGVVAADWAGPVERPPAPTLLCPATLGDPRKRGGLLLEAFALLRERLTDARLVLAGGADPFSGDGPAALPAGVEVADPGSTAELARAYRAASATVLPSVDEAFGLVLLESLAAGTPVVAARSGGCVDVVTADAVGRLFEPDDAADLARAMEQAVALGDQGDTVEACRAHAQEWEWSRVVGRYEAVYEAAV